ncbi:dienelactone hydrolase family protein [Nocardioides sp. DS6]|uniref:Dienelactone hydrolase family protein n=1 Tax=Nocardioides eburneus TaxID=3231482 RepID=A0ABV3SYI8_9ACTN
MNPGEVVERELAIPRSPLDVAGVLWTPAEPREPDAPMPVVLLGHGGSGHKRSARLVRLAAALAGRHGLAALAIDGPYHGDRAPADGDYQSAVIQEGAAAVARRAVAEWLVALDGASMLAPLDHARLAYVGLSMGTRHGLPLAAELGPRLRAAVLGKYGLVQGPALPSGLHVPETSLRAARSITCPVLFHLEWRDEVFPRDGQLALFDAIAAADKRMIVRNGRHAGSRPEDEDAWIAHVARALR